MRYIAALLVLFAGLVGYGAYRQRRVTLAQLERAAALQDSLRRADSLQHQAEIAAAESAQHATRRAMAQQNTQARSERAKPLMLVKPKTRVVVLKPIQRSRRP